MLALVPVFVVMGVLLSGCSPEPEPTPEPTAAFASEEEAFAAAEEVYRAYMDASNAVDYQDPSTFEPLETFITGSHRSSMRKSLSEMYAEGYSSSGEIIIEWFEGITFDSDATITARTCNDVSGTDVVDADGTSVVSDSRPSYYAIDLTFILDDGRLLLSSSQATKDQRCGS